MDLWKAERLNAPADFMKAPDGGGKQIKNDPNYDRHKPYKQTQMCWCSYINIYQLINICDITICRIKISSILVFTSG